MSALSNPFCTDFSIHFGEWSSSFSLLSASTPTARSQSFGRRQFDLDISDQNFDHDCFFKLPVLGSRHSQITHCGITRVLVWRSIEATFLVAFVVLSCATMLAACYSQTDKGQQPPNAEQKIRRIETLRLQYPLEPARWADHVDDNAVFTPGSGKVNTKTEILRLLHQQEWSYDSSLEMHEEQFKQLGDTAVLTYIYTRSRQDACRNQSL